MADVHYGFQKKSILVMALDKLILGKTGPVISRLGMGCWALGGHGWGVVDEAETIRAVQLAFDQGISFFDTADVYGLGKSETLLAKALGGNRKKAVIATKGGVRWEQQGKIWVDISPGYLRTAVERSLVRLSIDCIPLYYLHKPDGSTPLEESVACLDILRQEGKIGAIGVSNLSVEEFSRALKIAPIEALQVRLNIFEQKSLQDFLSICRENKVALIAWGVLADGLLTGKFSSNSVFGEDDHRSKMNLFKDEHFQSALRCVEHLRPIANGLGVGLSGLALRWVLDSAEVTIPLFGAKTPKQVLQNMQSVRLRLTPEDIKSINGIADYLRL